MVEYNGSLETNPDFDYVIKLSGIEACVLYAYLEQKYKECKNCKERGCKQCVFNHIKSIFNKLRVEMHYPEL